MVKPLVFEIPAQQSVKRLEIKLKQQLRLRLHATEWLTRRYLDTFDWRVFNQGGVLEATSGKSGHWLCWRDLGNTQCHGAQRFEELPNFVWDQEDSGLLMRLKKIVGPRALLAVACVYSRTSTLGLMNRQGKTVLRMELQVDYPLVPKNPPSAQPPAILAKRMQLYPLKGYAKAAERVRRFLQQHCALEAAGEDPLLTTLSRLQVPVPGPVNSAESIHPRQAAESSIKTLFKGQLLEMECNENGIRGDVDSEFLHEFRVAVRRTRALLTQADGLMAPASQNKFKGEFAWLGAVTGPARDLDVYLLSFATYQASLAAEQREDIAPLRQFLIRHKQHEQRKLVKALDSVRYQKLKQSWGKFLAAAVPLSPARTQAGLSSLDYASARIWRIYRKALRQGRSISLQSPREALHQLRKTCKKLRYMSEFFRELYPSKKITPLIQNLKKLQNNLGEFQDLNVQENALRRFIVDMELETGISSATRAAIHQLIANFERREKNVRAEFAERFARFASPGNKKIYRSLFAPPGISRDSHR